MGGCLVSNLSGEEKRKVCHVEKYFSLLKQCCFEDQLEHDGPHFHVSSKPGQLS